MPTRILRPARPALLLATMLTVLFLVFAPSPCAFAAQDTSGVTLTRVDGDQKPPKQVTIGGVTYIVLPKLGTIHFRLDKTPSQFSDTERDSIRVTIGNPDINNPAVKFIGEDGRRAADPNDPNKPADTISVPMTRDFNLQATMLSGAGNTPLTVTYSGGSVTFLLKVAEAPAQMIKLARSDGQSIPPLLLVNNAEGKGSDVKLKANAGTPDALLTWAASDNDAVSFSTDGQTFQSGPLTVASIAEVWVRGLKPTPDSTTPGLTISVTSAAYAQGQTPPSQTLSVKIVEPIGELKFDTDTIEIYQNATRTIALTTSEGRSPEAGTVTLQADPPDALDTPKFENGAITIVAKKGGRAAVSGLTVLTATYQSAGQTKTAKLKITIKPGIAGASLLGSLVVYKEQTTSVRLRFTDFQKADIPENAQEPFTAESSNPDVLLVEQDTTDKRLLRLTGVTAGTATILIKSQTAADNQPNSSGGATSLNGVVHIQVRVVQVSNFTKLRVKLQVMDEATATHAFGRAASKDFFIVQVSMFNDLDQSATTSGKTILAFSDTIETRVRIQKIYDPGSHTKLSDYQIRGLSRSVPSRAENGVSGFESSTPAPAGGKASAPPQRSGTTLPPPTPQERASAYSTAGWSDVLDWDYRNLSVTGTPDDYSTSVTLHSVASAPQEGAHTVSYPAAVSVRLALDQLSLATDETKLLHATPLDIDGKVVERGTLEWSALPQGIVEVSTNDGTIKGRKPGVATLTITYKNENNVAISQGTISVRVLADSLYEPHLFRYRPYSYELVVNTFDSRDRQNNRYRFFNVLNTLGTVGSFLTSFIKFDRHNNAESFLDKYSNLLLPGLEKLFPDQKETQRQNTVTMMMRPIEEIPFGSNVSRVLFFPKKPFRGYLLGHRTRISAIDAGFFEVEVAVIEKKEVSRTSVKQNGDNGNR